MYWKRKKYVLSKRRRSSEDERPGVVRSARRPILILSFNLFRAHSRYPSSPFLPTQLPPSALFFLMSCLKFRRTTFSRNVVRSGRPRDIRVFLAR